MNPRKISNALAIAASVACFASTASAQIVYLNKNGWFNPDGTASKRFSVVATGVCQVASGGELRLAPGSYREQLTISKPMTIKAESGTVTIGQTGQQRVPLRVVSYNTHLFGNPSIPGLPRFMDVERANWMIPSFVNENLVNNTDILGLQEVWDPVFWSWFAAQGSYPSGFYGGDHGSGGDILNSGLALFSKFTLQDTQQYAYQDQAGFDQFAHKGFLHARITKGGIGIEIFLTHTQADDEPAVRASQMNELAISIQLYRAANPSNPTIVLGDFNVAGETAEYDGNMSNIMGGGASQRDAARNMPCAGNQFFCTSCTYNGLHHCFYPDSTSSTRLDYILYAPSLNGTVDVIPKAYGRLDYEIPAGQPSMTCEGQTFRSLSDHYGVWAEFELVRN